MSAYWTRVRRCIIERDERRCRDCGRERIEFRHFVAAPREWRHLVWKLRLEVHHLSGPTGIDRYEPGPHNFSENLVTLCSPCHFARHGKRFRAFLRHPELALVGMPTEAEAQSA